MKKLFIVVVFLFLFSLLDSAKAFSVKPSELLITIDPGLKKTVSLQIVNPEKFDVNFSGKIYGVKQKNNGSPQFSVGYSVAEAWVKPKQSQILVPAGQSKNFDFTVDIPQSAQSGTYYLGLAIFKTGVNTSTVGLVGQVVSIFNLQVSGQAFDNISIDKWKLDENKTVGKEWFFDLNLSNKGNMEEQMTGNLLIKNWSGDNIYKENIYLGNRFLPNSVRYLKPQASLKDNIFWPGIYLAVVEIKYGLSGQTILATEHVWYWPSWMWPVTGFFVLGLLILVIFLVKIKRGLKKNRD